MQNEYDPYGGASTEEVEKFLGARSEPEEIPEPDQSAFSKAWNAREKGFSYYLEKEAKTPFGSFAKKLATYPLGPELLGTYGALKTIPMTVGAYLPYTGRFLSEGQRKAFGELDGGEKLLALALDTADAALMLFGGQAVEAVGKLKPVVKFAKLKPVAKVGKVLTSPIKEIPSVLFGKRLPKLPTGESVIEPYKVVFGYDEAIEGALKGTGLDAVERRAVNDVLQGGEPSRLKDVFFEKVVVSGERNTAPSDAFRSMIENVPAQKGKPFGVEYALRQEVRDRFSENSLRAAFNRKHILSQLKKHQFSTTEFPNEKWAEAVFRSQAKRFYGEAAEKMSLGDVTDDIVAGLIEDAVTHPKVVRQIKQPAGGLWFPWFSNKRTIFGGGETSFKTYSKVYEVAEKGNQNTALGNVDAVLRWCGILKEEGLLKDFKLTKWGRIKKTPEAHYTPEVVEAAKKRITMLDDLAEKSATADTVEAKEQLKRMHDGLMREVMSNTPTPVGSFIRSHRRMMDWAYGDRFYWEIPRVFKRSGLEMTAQGRRELDTILEKQAKPIIDQFLHSTEIPSHAEALSASKQVLELFRSRISTLEKDHPWFVTKGDDLVAGLEKLSQDLTMAKVGSNKGYMSYLESYTPRVANARARVTNNRMQSSLSTGKEGEPMRPYYAHARKRGVHEDAPPLTYEEIIRSRIGSHMKEKYLYPAVEEIATYSKDLPRAWRGTIDHYLTRLMGQPSPYDRYAADMLNRTWGRVFDGPDFSPSDITRYGQHLVNIMYLAGLAFRPFSAGRNLLQPLLNVPADLGGLRAWEHLAKAHFDLTRASVRKTLFEAKIMGDYAPDVLESPKFLPFREGKINFKFPFRENYHTLDTQALFNLGMWLFKSSDRGNRMITGAAALNKWNSGQKLIEKEDDLRSFVRKVGLNGRNPWIRDKIVGEVKAAKLINDLPLREAKIKEARNMYLRDVVGDTQFLYGAVDSPTAVGYGGVGRTFSIFQSYWMNYGNLMTKWMRTGDAPTKAGRLFNFMLSTALGGEIIARNWGSQRAVSSVGFGPFPTEDLPIPPAMHAVGTAYNNTMKAGRFLSGMPSKRELTQAKALIEDPIPTLAEQALREISVFTPGGVQIRNIVKEFKKSDPNILRAILELKTEEELKNDITPFKFLQMRSRR